MTDFENARRFSVYVKHSFIDFRMHSPKFRAFLNDSEEVEDYSRLAPYCYIAQSLKTKETEKRSN